MLACEACPGHRQQRVLQGPCQTVRLPNQLLLQTFQRALMMNSLKRTIADRMRKRLARPSMSVHRMMPGRRKAPLLSFIWTCLIRIPWSLMSPKHQAKRLNESRGEAWPVPYPCHVLTVWAQI